jgi:hypothetical protein
MNPRNRLINFRVTDEEFQRLKMASSFKNARCLSDFARSAILETAQACEAAAGPTDPVVEQLRAFDLRLAQLESTISRIFDAIAAAGSATDRIQLSNLSLER